MFEIIIINIITVSDICLFLSIDYSKVFIMVFLFLAIMEGSKNIEYNLLFLIIIFLPILCALIILGDSKIELSSSDNVQWRTVLDPQERFYDPTWVTYMREFKAGDGGGHAIKITLKNFSGGGIPFAWKSNKKKGLYEKFEFFINNTSQVIYDKSSEWENVTGYKVFRPEECWWNVSYEYGGKIWIAFPPTEIMQFPTPPVPQGPIFGLVGDNFDYSIANRISSTNKFNYILDWEDESPNTTANLLPNGMSAIANHTWTRSGEFKVRAKILSEESNIRSSNWSYPLSVIIYKKEEINPGDNLTFKTNNIENFTEIIINSSLNIISDCIKFVNKNHVNLTSKNEYTTIKGGYILSKMIELNNANNISIENLIFDNLESGIELSNCHNCFIKNNRINVSKVGYGVKLCSGDKNTIKDNQIKLINPPNPALSICPIGVWIESGNSIWIINNNIYTPNFDKQVLGYVFEKCEELKDITIKPTFNRKLVIKYGDCEGVWNTNEDFHEFGECEIPDDNNLLNVWHIP